MRMLNRAETNVWTKAGDTHRLNKKDSYLRFVKSGRRKRQLHKKMNICLVFIACINWYDPALHCCGKYWTIINNIYSSIILVSRIIFLGLQNIPHHKVPVNLYITMEGVEKRLDVCTCRVAVNDSISKWSAVTSGLLTSF